MNYKIIPTEYFKKQVRELIKDYPNIKRDLKELSRMLKEDPKCGKSLGKKVYKIRLKSSDIPKGKRSKHLLDCSQI
jgi:mRNA-degrading endonuclease RelE of RelBE toxin-antitoxin system